MFCDLLPVWNKCLWINSYKFPTLEGVNVISGSGSNPSTLPNLHLNVFATCLRFDLPTF